MPCLYILKFFLWRANDSKVWGWCSVVNLIDKVDDKSDVVWFTSTCILIFSLLYTSGVVVYGAMGVILKLFAWRHTVLLVLAICTLGKAMACWRASGRCGIHIMCLSALGLIRYRVR